MHPLPAPRGGKAPGRQGASDPASKRKRDRFLRHGQRRSNPPYAIRPGLNRSSARIKPARSWEMRKAAAACIIATVVAPCRSDFQNAPKNPIRKEIAGIWFRTEYPRSHLPIPSDRRHGRSWGNPFFMSARVSAEAFAYSRTDPRRRNLTHAGGTCRRGGRLNTPPRSCGRRSFRKSTWRPPRADGRSRARPCGPGRKPNRSAACWCWARCKARNGTRCCR